MNLVKIIILVMLFVAPTIASGQLQIPDLSPKAEIIQTIGYTRISAIYFRPSLKGRSAFGDEGILPFGQVWRTGANAATKISFSDNVSFAGKKIQKGEYCLLTIPDRTQWTISLYPYSSTDWNDYVELKPVLRVRRSVTALKTPIESFEIVFKNIGMENVDMVLGWGNTAVYIPIEIEVRKVALKKIERVMDGPSDFDYFLAGLYLHEIQTDLEKALMYVRKASKKVNALFFQVYREALILKDLGKKDEALKAAHRALELSKNADNDDFIRLNKKLIDQLTS